MPPPPSPTTSAPSILVEVSNDLRYRWAKTKVFRRMCRVVSYLLVAIVGYLLWGVLCDGWSWLSWDFFTQYASRWPERSGIKVAILGSVWVISITMLVAIPLGVGAGTYIEELMPEGKLKSFISINIQNLAGVPSIVYGILGLALFVRTLGFGHSILSGGLTLGMLVLPIIIIVTRESLRNVPMHIRQAALALGATKWQTVKCHILPTSFSGILTGVILAVSEI